MPQDSSPQLIDSGGDAEKSVLGLRAVPTAILIVLLLVRCILTFAIPVSNGLNGDEHDYVPKARALWSTGRFPAVKPIGPQELVYSDFRPPGYPLVIAPLLVFGDSCQEIRRSATAFHLVMDAIVTTILFLLCRCFSRRLLFECVAAVVLGVQPWTSAWAPIIITETSVVFLVFVGIMALWRFCMAGRVRTAVAWLIVSSILLNATFTMRPEMIVFVPPLIVIAILCRDCRASRFFGYACAACVPMVVFAGGLVTYRINVAGEPRVFGQLEHKTPGLALWAATWAGSEAVKMAAVCGTPRGNDTFLELPDAAFDNADERNCVREIITRIHQAGSMCPADDAAFMTLARQRIERNPLRYYVWVRLHNAWQMWINLETSSAYLHWFARLPRWLSKVLVGGCLGLRLVILAMAALGILRLWHALHGRHDKQAELFLALGSVFIIERTCFFGLYVYAFEARYMAPAWPFVLALGLYGLAWSLSRRRGQPAA
jgi:hypothetical protein